MILTNVRIFQDHDIKKGHVIVEENKIKQILFYPLPETLSQAHNEIIDCKDNLLLPGFIDSHVHFRDTGQIHKESLITGSQAAIESGITTVLTMPNTNPPLSTVENLIDYKKLGNNEEIQCNILYFTTISKGFSLDHLKDLKKEGIRGIKIYPKASCDSLPLKWDDKWRNDSDSKEFISKINNIQLNDSKLVDEYPNWEKLFDKAKELELPLLIHPELITSNEKYTEVNDSKIIHMKNSNLYKHHKEHPIKGNERAVVEMMITFMRQFYPINKDGQKLAPHIHFCHVSSPEVVNIINSCLRDANYPCSIEVTPHHFLLNYDEEFSNEAYGKVLTPLRSPKTQLELFNLLKESKIDTIGTDHAPHTIEEKTQGDFPTAPSGLPYLDISTRILLSEVFNFRFPLDLLVYYYSTNPARIFNLPNKGEIQEGFDADLVLVEKVESYPINTNEFKSKQKWHPFTNKSLNCKIKSVISQGKIILNK